MKTTAVAVLLVLAGVPALAASPVELIRGVGADMLEDYSRPLVESYGVAMGSGWYHSAHALGFLRFEIGARLSLINIPEAARTFTARAKACSVNTQTGAIDTFYVDVEGAATIFGPGGSTPVPVPGEYSVAIPPSLPGGLGVSWMPFVVPQASLGLPLGFEITARYVPWPFQGTTVHFLGVGVKNELTTFFRLPVNLAVQGFYQQFAIGDAVRSRTLGGNIHASRSLLLFAPYAGIGFDRSATDINYVFHARYPTGIGEGGLEYEEFDIPVNASYAPPVNLRGTLGVALKFGLLLVNADYNYNVSTGYHAVSAGVSASLR
ncbi:MAG: DUF6588 family protein [bacterium]